MVGARIKATLLFYQLWAVKAILLQDVFDFISE